METMSLHINSSPVKPKAVKKALIIFFIAGIAVTSCSKSSSNFSTDCSTAKSWSTDVSPIIQSSCTTNSGCHGTGSTHGPGALTSYAEVFNSRSAIRSAVASGTMPQNGSLSTAQKNAILCWVDSGATNN